MRAGAKAAGGGAEGQAGPRRGPHTPRIPLPFCRALWRGSSASVRLARGPQQPRAHPRRPSARQAGTAPAPASRPARQLPLGPQRTGPGPSTGADRRRQRDLPGTPLPPLPTGVLLGSETLWERRSQARSGRAARDDGAGVAAGQLCPHADLLGAGWPQPGARWRPLCARTQPRGWLQCYLQIKTTRAVTQRTSRPRTQARGPRRGGRRWSRRPRPGVPPRGAGAAGMGRWVTGLAQEQRSGRAARAGQPTQERWGQGCDDSAPSEGPSRPWARALGGAERGWACEHWPRTGTWALTSVEALRPEDEHPARPGVGAAPMGVGSPCTREDAALPWGITSHPVQPAPSS